jgi:diguanylate cyclase
MAKARSAKGAQTYDYQAMIAGARHGVFVHHNFRPLYANDAWAKMLGYDNAAAFLKLKLLRPLVPPENWPILEGRYSALMRDKIPAGMTRLRLLRQDGTEIWLALTERKVVWRGHDAAEWHAFDISEQMLLEQQLLASEQKLRAVLEVLPYPVMIARRDDGGILFVNRKACLLLNQSAGLLLKNSMFDYFHSEVDRNDFLAMLGAIRELREQELKMQAFGGREFIVEMAAILTDYNGQTAVLLALNDISARKQLETELFQQANTDALTGISNRRHLIARAEQELRRARRFARPLAVMMLDLDHFKAINDRHGHAGGDAVLRAVAGAFSACLRGTDSFGRIGGEEFAIIMPETELRDAADVADRMRQRISELVIEHDGALIHATVSIGVTALLAQDGDIDAVLHRADQALYMAKQDGRNRVVGME